MAKAQNTGSGAAIAATILGILFVFALVAAIIFNTQTNKVRTERDQYAQDLAGLATPEERNLETIRNMMNNRDAGSVVGQYIAEVEQLRRLAAADTSVDSASLKKRMSEGLKLSDGANLVVTVSTLQAELKKANESTQQVQGQLDEARKNEQQAKADLAKLSKTYNDSVAQLQGKIDQLTQAQAQYQGTVQKSTGELEKTIAAVRADLQSQIDGKQSEIDQLRAELQTVTNQRDRLLSITRELAVNDVVQADGQISALVEQEGLVYVNLGRVQHMVPGMTFEIFEPGEIIKPDEFQEVRGKATIEVAKVDPTASSARVVRLDRGKTVRPGDQVVNLAFDPNVTYQFYVYGDFDIDNTGQSSLGDRKRIEAMVSKFGAVVAPELSYEVDYLVLGEEPTLPPPLPADVLDPELIAQNVAARRKYETYQQLIGEAKNLRIPVLNQNRFLALVGYYQR